MNNNIIELINNLNNLLPTTKLKKFISNNNFNKIFLSFIVPQLFYFFIFDII